MKKALSLIAVCALIMVLTYCGSPSEGLVAKYFQVMQMLDKDSMTSMALNPVEIEFKDYEIVSSTEPYESELLLPKYLQQLEQIQEQKKEIMQRANELEGEIIDMEYDIEDTRSTSRKRQLREEMEEKQEQLDAIKFEFTKVLQREYEVEQLIEREETLVKKSTSLTENLADYTGVIKRSEVFVDVTLPTDKHNQYVFILSAYEVQKGEGEVVPNRMIIENIMTKADYEEMINQQQEEEPQVPTEEVLEEDPQQEEMPQEEGSEQ